MRRLRPRLFALVYRRRHGRHGIPLQRRDCGRAHTGRGGRRTRGEAGPLPYLLICAFIANAASFVLPISNPANLVVYGSRMPPLLQWLPRFALPSLVSIATTYLVLAADARGALQPDDSRYRTVPTLSRSGRVAAGGIALTAIALIAASALGLAARPTDLPGRPGDHRCCRAAPQARAPWPILQGISWGVLPLVAGLFVLVQALKDRRHRALGRVPLQDASRASATGAAWTIGIVLGFACNLMNNLPAGLVAGAWSRPRTCLQHVRSAVLIGVDLGPNLSVTGSLATILWLSRLRREGQKVSAWTFLKLGALVMPPALLLALGALALAAEKTNPGDRACRK